MGSPISRTPSKTVVALAAITSKKTLPTHFLPPLKIWGFRESTSPSGDFYFRVPK